VAAVAEMAEARMARDDHARRAATLDDELAQVRREHAAELVRRDEEREAALAGRDAEAAQAAEPRNDEDVTEVATLDQIEQPEQTEQVGETEQREPPDPVEGDPGETVRVLGARRPRRTGEGAPADAAPGTGAIGARYIEPGQTPQRSAIAEWVTRVLAFAALTVVIVALLLVLKPF
jgi:hypothetical protein